jgi:hypothetical protein
MAKKLNVTKEQLLEAIEGSQGLVSKIQRKLMAAIGEKISWDAVDRLVKKYPEAEAAVKAEKEAMLDIAENNIFKDMVNGDTATSKWYLRMKGKERGYEDTPTIQIANEDPLNINLTGDTMTAEALKESADIEVTGGAPE